MKSGVGGACRGTKEGRGMIAGSEGSGPVPQAQPLLMARREGLAHTFLGR